MASLGGPGVLRVGRVGLGPVAYSRIGRDPGGVLLDAGVGLVTSGLQALWMPALDYYPGITAQTVPDRSGNGNTLQLGSTPGVDVNDPSWSQQGLVSNSSGSQYAKTPSAIPQVDNITLGAVAMYVGGGGPIFIYNGDPSANGLGIYVNTSNEHAQALYGGVAFEDSGVVLAPATWSDLALVRSGTAQFYRNATLFGSAITGTPNAVTGGMQVGEQSTTIAAGYAYNRALSVGELTRVHRWLRSQLAPSGITLP